VCEVVRFYDRWVNGADLRLPELAIGKAPSGVPLPSPGQVLHANRTVIQLAGYEGCTPALPTLDPCGLSTVRTVLVHGSVATRDACAFSDIDVAVVVDDVRSYTAEQHRRAVHELRRLLRAVLEFDPLMHHGLMFFPLSGLENYDQRFLPIDALKCARVLHGSPVLHLHATPAPLEQLRATLKSAALSLRKRFAAMEFVRNDYQLKNVLAGILLMPARILAAQGVHVYKRESFELARSLFTPAQWELVARSEALRSTWVRPPSSFLHRMLPPNSHPHLLRIAGSRFAPLTNARRLSAHMIESLQHSASVFLDRVEAMI
jgi:Polymerase beta, Nucleotidyltransferase